MKDNQSRTVIIFGNVGLAANQESAGYAVRNAKVEKAMRIGRRPIRSDYAPIMGSQMKFDIPTQIVTIRLSAAVSLRTVFPKVGV